MLDIYAKINIKEMRKMLYNVGRRIREARKSQNLTQEKLAEHAGLSLLLSRFRLLSSKDQENLSGFLNVMLNLSSN